MSARITSVRMDNFGIIPSFSCDHFSNINLIIGENSVGKTFFLKGLYSAIRTLEEYKKGDDIRSLNEVISEKLRWTFQVEKLGDIVTRSTGERLEFSISTTKERFLYSFSKTTTNRVIGSFISAEGKRGNSVFIPAKEILSLFSIVLKSREIDKSFGFDDTYYDLAKALRIPPLNEPSTFSRLIQASSGKSLRNMIDGRIEYDETSGKWFYRNRRGQKFTIGATSEGIKKISVMDRLLSNGYLDEQSIIFIDEIEASLHPDAICLFLDMIDYIARGLDLQFFITSHSYFVIKKLALIAMDRPNWVTCISLGKDKNPEVYDLHDGMPDNSIINTSIQLYEEEIGVKS